MEPRDYLKMWFFLKMVEYVNYGDRENPDKHIDHKDNEMMALVSKSDCPPCNSPAIGPSTQE